MAKQIAKAVGLFEDSPNAEYHNTITKESIKNKTEYVREPKVGNL